MSNIQVQKLFFQSKALQSHIELYKSDADGNIIGTLVASSSTTTFPHILNHNGLGLTWSATGDDYFLIRVRSDESGMSELHRDYLVHVAAMSTDTSAQVTVTYTTWLNGKEEVRTVTETLSSTNDPVTLGISMDAQNVKIEVTPTNVYAKSDVDLTGANRVSYPTGFWTTKTCKEGVSRTYKG